MERSGARTHMSELQVLVHKSELTCAKCTTSLDGGRLVTPFGIPPRLRDVAGLLVGWRRTHTLRHSWTQWDSTVPGTNKMEINMREGSRWCLVDTSTYFPLKRTPVAGITKSKAST